MLYRHDRLKIGYERVRKSGLTDYQMQRLFEALSFVSLNDNLTRFSSQKFRKYLENSANLERISENVEDDLIEDITGITALVVRDGFDDYSFSHKSIQEYFSAVFIARLNDERKKKFYTKVIVDFNEYRKWQNTLAFLYIIDERDYTKHFFIPFKRNSLNLDSRDRIRINYKALTRMIGDDSKIEVNEDGELLKLFWGDTFSSSLYRDYSDYTKQLVKSFLENRKEDIANFLAFCDVADYAKYQHGERNFIISIDVLLTAAKLQKDACDHVSSRFESSSFKDDLVAMEKDLISAESAADDILEL